MMTRLLMRLVGQERARANARSAATELGRLRVEREQVRLFLDELDARRRATRSA
jgi:hypothetical protein